MGPFGQQCPQIDGRSHVGQRVDTGLRVLSLGFVYPDPGPQERLFSMQALTNKWAVSLRSDRLGSIIGRARDQRDNMIQTAHRSGNPKSR